MERTKERKKIHLNKKVKKITSLKMCQLNMPCHFFIENQIYAAKLWINSTLIASK